MDKDEEVICNLRDHCPMSIRKNWCEHGKPHKYHPRRCENHGCERDIKSMWVATCRCVPVNQPKAYSS